ncbi:MAG: hypothetical protein AB8G22_06160, partial [Saprospiraceae bacterium]
MRNSLSFLIRISTFLFAVQMYAQPAFVGDEYLINTISANRDEIPQIACDRYGNHVIIWTNERVEGEDFNVFGRVFNADGTARTDEFLVNTFTFDKQWAGKVAMSPTGNFTVVWQSNKQDNNGIGIYGQQYDIDGNRLGSEFQVNQLIQFDQTAADIAMDAQGNFAVSWETNIATGIKNIQAARFSADGLPLGDEFRVNLTTSNINKASEIAMDAAGNFIIAWINRVNESDAEGEIFVQRFAADGTRIGTEFSVTEGMEIIGAGRLSIDMNAHGDFVICWPEKMNIADAIQNFYAQWYHADGTIKVAKKAFNQALITTTNGEPKLFDNGNTFISYYHSPNNNDTYGRYFNNLGDAIGNEFSISQTTTNNEIRNSIAGNNEQVFVLYQRDQDELLVRKFANLKSTNNDCESALSLQLNQAACGNFTNTLQLSAAEQQAWAKIIVPTTGSFLIKNVNASFAANISAYSGGCDNLTLLTTADLNVLPNVIAIENQTPGDTIYVKIEPQTPIVTASETIELSAHQLAADPTDWELCDLSIAANNTTGGGNRIAVEFLVQYTDDASTQEVQTVQQDLTSTGATLKKECPCKNGQPLQLWETLNPIEMETNVQGARNKS